MDGLGPQMIKRKRQMFSEREYSSCFPQNAPVSSSGHKLFPFIPGPSGRCPFGWSHIGTASCSPRSCGPSSELPAPRRAKPFLPHPWLWRGSAGPSCLHSCWLPWLLWVSPRMVTCPCVLGCFRVLLCLCLTLGLSLPDPGTVSHSCGTADEPALAAQGNKLWNKLMFFSELYWINFKYRLKCVGKAGKANHTTPSSFLWFRAKSWGFKPGWRWVWREEKKQ